MGQYSIGEALSVFLEKSRWKQKVYELRLRREWEQIVGKTVARYTRDLKLYDQRLSLFTDIAALKQELSLGRAQLVEQINAYFGETVVTEVIVK